MGTDAEPAPEGLPAPAPAGVSPDTVRDWRWQLTPGEDQINTATWAGSVPQVNGIAPRVRVGRGKWFAAVAVALLAAQLGLVRPRLNRRASQVLAAGSEVPRSRAHARYIAAEIAKVAAPTGLGASLLTM